MTQDSLRETRTENLRQAQAKRKDDTLERAYKAIEALQKTGSKINFPTIAREAKVSVSYLYKYPELKQHIGELRNQQSSMPRKPLTKSAVSDSQSKIISRLKGRVRQLEEQNNELRRKNEALAGQVYRIHYLQDQVERQQQTIEDLQSRLKEAFAQSSVVKVTPLAQAKSRQLSDVIQQELESLRIRLTENLNRVIRAHGEETVLLAIKAFRQYKETHKINNLAACLRRAIEEGWVPNEASTPSTSEQDEFDQFYADAVACGFLLDIPKNYLPVQGGEIIVKINRASVYGSWTPMPWRQAEAEYEEEYTNC